MTESTAVPTESGGDWPGALEETIDLLRTRHPNPFRRQDRETFNRAIGSARRRVRSASPQPRLALDGTSHEPCHVVPLKEQIQDDGRDHRDDGPSLEQSVIDRTIASSFNIQ